MELSEQSAKTGYMSNYRNILTKDRLPSIMTQSFNPTVPVIKNKYQSPDELKSTVLKSQRITRFIEDIYLKLAGLDAERKKELTDQAVQMLMEIGFDRSMLVLRMMGSATTMMMKQIYQKVQINEKSLMKLKKSLGHQQVIYLPSHRSYVDFILMSWICFSHNIEIPAIAAGMDFHGMMGMGAMLRKTGAFFMRRTFSGEPLYWKLFKEYMHKLMMINHRGLEFFLEGTRSRSCKALTPKIGLLSMALEPLFMGEMYDVTIVPVSVSYEKPLEEQLFVYELLGIPKPKESTFGLIKGMRSLAQNNYGSIYFDFGEPLSAKEYFKSSINRFQHSVEPAHVQILSKDELNSVTDLANEVVRRQQQKIVIMSFNLIALITSHNYFLNRTMHLDQIQVEVLKLAVIFEEFGAIVAINKADVLGEIENTLDIHSNILKLDKKGHLELIKSKVMLGEMNANKLKGHHLCDETMNISIPVFSMQLYNNPTLFWLAQPSLMILSVKYLSVQENSSSVSISQVKEHVNVLRKIFSYEFVMHQGHADVDFTKSLKNLIDLNVLEKQSNNISTCQNETTSLILSAIAPFLCTYYQVASTILQKLSTEKFEDKEICVAVQAAVEQALHSRDSMVHPYCLSLDCVNLAVLAFCNLECLYKEKQNMLNFYSVNVENLEKLVELLKSLCSFMNFNYHFFDGQLTAKM